MFQYEPFHWTEYGNNGTHIYTGLCFEILLTLAEFLNFRFSVRAPPDGEWGVQGQDGNWSGMIGMVQNQVTFYLT